MIKWKAVFLTALIAAVASGAAVAGPVEDLTTFTAGTPARADEVNGNFNAVAGAVNDNDARVTALEAEIAELREQLSNVLNIDPYLSLETVNSQPAIRISGANLQLVNGLGETATANGTGNLLIGYDEVRPDGDPECSIGFDAEAFAGVTNELECADVGGLWALDHKSGSHYLVVGAEHNYSRWGGIVVGWQNTSNYDFASVSGGGHNAASGPRSSVSGGFGHTAAGSSASISGGFFGMATGPSSSISGGFGNTASGQASSVSGGTHNTSSGFGASVSGGDSRDAPADDDWVAGSLFEDF